MSGVNMAGNKINSKTRSKEDKGKNSKVGSQSNEDNEDLDFTLLRKPVVTSVTGFAQARKIFDFATEELKDLLTNECDLLYECKVCRNIFRSLVNFVSHKRIYCQDKFNTSVHGHFIQAPSTVNEYFKIKQTEEYYQHAMKNGAISQDNEDADSDRIPLTKDLTEVVEKITKNRGVSQENEMQEVSLQKIPSSTVAVFQHMEPTKEDNMRAQINELDVILSRDKAVLQSDGKFVIEKPNRTNKVDPDNVIQISDDDENDSGGNLKCKICDLQFSTQKTLKFHMKYKHLESRLVYPCPDCCEVFSTSWSVYRHLFKVHRKTAAQIRRLRESIQAKAFKMNNPPAFYEKRKNNMQKPAVVAKITEEERLDQENQAWMDNMEADGEVPRCGGCGRAFPRRAALQAHTHTCQTRNRARQPTAAGRRDDKREKKIEIQIRKDYNKGPPTGLSILKPDAAVVEKTEKPAEDPPPAPPPAEDPVDTAQETEKIVEENDKNAVEEAPMDIADDELKSDDSADSPAKTPEDEAPSVKPDYRLPFGMQAEKSNLAAFRRRMQPEVDFRKLLCKKCDTTHETAEALHKHMAGHLKWMRYSCKLCNFKHYEFENLPEHVKTVHKLKGDADFYVSTLKAIDGIEAMLISKCLTESESADENSELNETSPESRRPSRCSSDSSRLSDDSSSSSTLKETGARKRKMYPNKGNPKKKKQDDGEDEKDGHAALVTALKDIIGDKDSSLIKNFEENSSDMDDVEEKLSKKTKIANRPAVTSRRPVRKRTKPKNEDFEYDLSNLLKMEAQGYRDSQSVVTAKSAQPKKKPTEPTPSAHDMNKECCGALATLTKKALDVGSAALKTSFACFTYQKERPSNVFARPMIPKVLKLDKVSPRKDVIEDTKDSSSPIKVTKSSDTPPVKEDKPSKPIEDKTSKPIEELNNTNDETVPTETVEPVDRERERRVPTILKQSQKNKNEDSLEEKRELLLAEIKNLKRSQNNKELDSPGEKKESLLAEIKNKESILVEKMKSNMAIPTVVPLKFRRQSLEVMKNPLINKNITDFTKAGMKTKILVIKPINRNKDGTQVASSALKFQTIKLKEPRKSSSTEDKPSDQVVVVKVPKVECGNPRTVSETSTSNSDKPSATLNATSSSSTNNKDTSEKLVDGEVKSNTDTTTKEKSNTNATSKEKSNTDTSTKEATRDVEKKAESAKCETVTGSKEAVSDTNEVVIKTESTEDVATSA